jgi:hypothetical protein
LHLNWHEYSNQLYLLLTFEKSYIEPFPTDIG